LNFSLSDYVQVVSAARGEEGEVVASRESIALLHFFKDLLKFAGAENKVVCNPDLVGLRAYRFRNNSHIYLGLLQELLEANIKYITGEARPLLAKPVTVTLPKKYHIYDIRKAEYLGYSDAIHAEIEPARAELYGLLPYRVKGLAVAATESVMPGGELQYTANIEPATGNAETHVFHIDLISPDGRVMKYYSENLQAVGGKTSGKITLALNETPGKWQVKIRDVVSGISNISSFLITTEK
jgi:hypothetical protein